MKKLNDTLNKKDFYKLKLTFRDMDKFFVYSYRLVGAPFEKERVYSNAYDILKHRWTNICLAGMSEEEFFDGLKEFDLGSWKSNYNSLDQGIAVLDGFSWKVEVKYYSKNKKTKIFCGTNAYPDNFWDFLDFLEIDFDSQDWVELDNDDKMEDDDDKTLIL